MRVLILGAGAIGGYYGSRLIEAGHDVTFLVRPARAGLLSERGLLVSSAQHAFARPVQTLTTAAAGSVYDLVIVACKAFDLDAAIAAVAPAIGTGTQVLSLLNGMRQLDVLDAAFGAQHVLGGVCHVSVTLDAEGAIRQFGALDRLTFGSCNPQSGVADNVASGLCSLGPNLILSADILAAMWEKFAFIAALAGITCLMRGAVGEIVATADGADLARRLYQECAQTARCSGHVLPTQAMDEAERFLTTPGSPLKASMLRDVERGARTEAEHILGDLHSRAQAHAIDTPLLAAALAHLRVYEAQRQRGA